MSFKPVSKKINKAVLGITLQSEFMKQGNAMYVTNIEYPFVWPADDNEVCVVCCSDDDMQSTFSAVSTGQDSLQFDEEEEEEEFVDSPKNTKSQGTVGSSKLTLLLVF